MKPVSLLAFYGKIILKACGIWPIAAALSNPAIGKFHVRVDLLTEKACERSKSCDKALSNATKSRWPRRLHSHRVARCHHHDRDSCGTFVPCFATLPEPGKTCASQKRSHPNR